MGKSAIVIGAGRRGSSDGAASDDSGYAPHGDGSISTTSSSTGSSGSGGSDGEYDVDKAIQRAKMRASMRLRAEITRNARRQSLPALMAKMNADLNYEDDPTPQQIREQVQIERAREAVHEQLVARKLLVPSAAASSPARFPRQPRASLPQLEVPTRSQPTFFSHPQLDLSLSDVLSPTMPPTPTTTSPMAAAAARRRQRLLEAAGGGGSGGSGGGQHSPGAGGRGMSRRTTFAAQPPSPDSRGAAHASGGECEADGRASRMSCSGIQLPRLAGAEALDSDDSEVDLGTMVRGERRRLAKVQSKVTNILRSQKRYQGLLADKPAGSPGATAATSAADSLTLTPEELTASIIPQPAQPPDGVELKVPENDIRFSGVKLRFLMGLLEAIEPHPVLCRTTADLVSSLVVPLTADGRCRLLDLIPEEHRGQPHHYVCHAWSCSVTDLLRTLQREMLPPPPPRPPPLALPGLKPQQPLRAGAGTVRSLRVGALRQDSGQGQGPQAQPQGPQGPRVGAEAAGAQGPAAAATARSAAGIGGATARSAASAAGEAGGGKGFLPSIGRGASGQAATGGAAAAAGGVGKGADSEAAVADAYAAMLGSHDAVWEHYEQLNQKYKEELDCALEQVVWLDVVCNNQHALAKRDYSKVAKAVVGCGATILVLDRQLTPLSRAWCLFELMHCLRCKRHLKVFRVDPHAERHHGHGHGHSHHGHGHHGHAGQPPGGGAIERSVAGSGGGGVAAGSGASPVPQLESATNEEKRWEKLVESINVAEGKASLEQDRVGILQEILNTVGTAFANDTLRRAMRLSNAERARQLALRRQQLRQTMELLSPDPAAIGLEAYEANLSRCREHLQAVLQESYPQDMLRCIIPVDYVSDSARCWDMLCIFAQILERELFREDAKTLRAMAWLIFKRHSKRYIEVLYEKELDNWLVNSLEHDRKWRRVQAKLKHDAQNAKKWNAS